MKYAVTHVPKIAEDLPSRMAHRATNRDRRRKGGGPARLFATDITRHQTPSRGLPMASTEAIAGG